MLVVGPVALLLLTVQPAAWAAAVKVIALTPVS